jgi:predicted phage-related endonuclease
MGIPTASQFDAVLTKGRGGAESKTRRTYLLKLVGERLTQTPMDVFSNAHMERGHEMEEEARRLYLMVSDAELSHVGFMRRGDVGASPDSLVGDDGLLEIKTKLPHLQVDLLLSDEIPKEHIAQLQGQMWIADREWVDFASYWPGLPFFLKRVGRDEKFISNLATEVAAFNDEVAAIVEQVAQYGKGT